MSRGINKVILIGNLGNAPEIKYAPSGDCIANFSLATSESWKDKQTGEPQERTEWHRVVAFRRLGEICSEYLSKGSKVYLEGKLQTRKWQDKAGADREIVAETMQMLDSRQPGEPSPGPGTSPDPRARRPPQQLASRQQATLITHSPLEQQAAATKAPPALAEGFEDDDLPF